MAWTPDQVIKLVGEIGGIVTATGVLVQALHNNKTVAINSSNNAHQTLMTLASKFSPSAPVSGTENNSLTQKEEIK